MTVEPLRDLLDKLDTTTKDLETAFQERDAAENTFKVSRSKVQSLMNQRDLIKEKIMAEKILIRELK